MLNDAPGLRDAVQPPARGRGREADREDAEAADAGDAARGLHLTT